MEPNAEAPDRSLNNVLDLICPQRGQQSPVFPFSAVRLPSSLSHVKYVSCSLMSWQIGCRSRLASSQKPCWYTWYLCVWSLACVTLALHSWLMSQSILDVFSILTKLYAVRINSCCLDYTSHLNALPALCHSHSGIMNFNLSEHDSENQQKKRR